MSENKEEWMQRMVDMLGVDPEDIMEVAEMFYDEIDDELASIRSAYEEGDIETLSRLAHGLKGSSANMGFESISELAKKLEIEAKAGAVISFDAQLQLIAEAVADRRAFVGL